MKCDCIERPIRRLFALYGVKVARYPIPFIVIPILIAFIFGGGFAFMKRETDIEYLFTPENSQTRKDQATLKDDFSSIKDYDPSRSLNTDVVGRVIITNTNSDANIWEKKFLDEIQDLDTFITDIKADGISYEDVCSKSEGKCIANGLSLLDPTNDIKYPNHEVSQGPSNPPLSIFLGQLLGGVETDSNDLIQTVKALQLVYYLDDSDDGKEWALTFIEKLDDKTFSNIKIEKWTFYSIEEELGSNTLRIIPFFSITFTILITFSILATTLLDPVRTKPWLGFCGVISAGLAITTAFGLLMYAGIPFVDLVAVAPFLALGIGVDDMFVMLAAWRKTNHYVPVEERMSEAFSEAAMSITITSVTDVLAVGIGAVTPFPSVRIFCAYTGLTLFMDYFFQITFFAGCMALTGKREQANRHAWTCMKVPARSEAAGRSKCYLMCCAGGVASSPNEHDNTDVTIMIFFRDLFSRLIIAKIGKAVVIILWLVYLGIGIWGCMGIEQGLELKNLAPDGSYVADFYSLDEKYFQEFDYKVQVVVHASIDSKTKADEIEDMISKYEDAEEFRGSEFTDSWLRDYENYASDKGLSIDYNNLFDSKFDDFLSETAFKKYEKDVISKDNIFRFIVTSNYSIGTASEMRMMAKAREIAGEFPDLDVIAFSSRFIIVEQYVEVFPNTMQNLGIAVASMLVISLLLIPHPIVSIWVTLSIVSICVGVVGFMSLWSVGLDTVSMINLIMCIGFCVDFSAHITYAFVTSKEVGRDDRVKDSLYTLGLPILQGSVSTILAVCVLSASFAYIFRTFFKVMFLVILFGTLHGLFLLPVSLSLMGPKGSKDDAVSSNGTLNLVKVKPNSRPATPEKDYPI